MPVKYKKTALMGSEMFPWRSFPPGCQTKQPGRELHMQNLFTN